MNKREAKFIMQLPDGYEWAFISGNNAKNNFLCGAASDKEVLLYEIIDEQLIKREIKMEGIVNGEV